MVHCAQLSKLMGYLAQQPKVVAVYATLAQVVHWQLVEGDWSWSPAGKWKHILTVEGAGWECFEAPQFSLTGSENVSASRCLWSEQELW